MLWLELSYSFRANNKMFLILSVVEDCQHSDRLAARKERCRIGPPKRGRVICEKAPFDIEVVAYAGRLHCNELM